ncbi:MAG TPA: protein kinase, partial [Kofleriaceae bacterium]
MTSTTSRGDGRFELRRQLGAGGMGIVHEALDVERGTLVALKALRQASPLAIARFKREFRSLANVIHPNLVALYELLAEGDDVFFTMELVRGVHFDRWVSGGGAEDGPSTSSDTAASASQATRSLASGSRAKDATDSTTTSDLPKLPLPARRPIDVSRLRESLRQLAEGVAALHDHGLLHRDLKPSNVLVDDTGRLVILDFGLVTDIAEESLQLDDDRPLQGTFS